MKHFSRLGLALALSASTSVASAGLTTAGTWSGSVGLSVDGIGSNFSPVGTVQAEIPVGATIMQAYLYSAGQPFPYYSNSPTTLAAYNAAGITLNGSAVNNFSTLVGAITSPRPHGAQPEIGRFFTARADVTSLVQTFTTGAMTSSFSWAVTEGSLNRGIDGEVLAIVYSAPGLPQATVALLDGGHDPAGETSIVNLATAVPDVSSGLVRSRLGLGISFNPDGGRSTVRINGDLLTLNAGDLDDGLQIEDGSSITVGGIGDRISNGQSQANDHELYDVGSFLHTGDTSFSIFTQADPNTAWPNLFFASLSITAIPEPETWALMLAGIGIIGSIAHRRRRA